MQMVAADVDAALARVNQIATGVGATSWRRASGRRPSTGNVQARAHHVNVPAERFGAEPGQVRWRCVTSEQASGRDVTEEYVDLEARLTNLEATRPDPCVPR
ncbi:MAG: DUF4349 domain-containing protein [Caldilineaceae bacterium]|nr:DUF4349 domain-containing protein [Caldilineaceae bacterium]